MKISEGYEPRWDIDLEFGMAGEKTVADLLGMIGTIEVKRDRHTYSNNLVIETHRFEGTQWIKSGIHTSQANYWVYIMGSTYTIVPTGVIRLALSVLDLEEKIITIDTPTRCVLLPRTLLQQVK